MTNDQRLARQNATLRSASALRGGLILAIIAFQSIEVSDSYTSLSNTPIWVVPGWSIAGLFGLAGFAAMRGTECNGIGIAAGRAAARLLIGLVIVVVATALPLGLAVTTLGRRAYLLDPEVPAYLLNVVGVPRLTLPGVFEFNASAQIVNPAVATVPVAYAAGAVMLLAALRPRWTEWVLVGVAVSLVVASGALFAADRFLDDATGSVGQLLYGQGLASLLCFILGALGYRWRRHLPIDWRLAVPAGVVLTLAAGWGNRSWLDNPLFAAATALPLAYLTIYACSLPLPFRHGARQVQPLYWRTFLLAYPVQQVWILLGPDRQGAAVNLLLSLPVIVALAVAAWFLVERPVLSRLLPAPFRPVAPALPPSKRGGRRPVQYLNQVRAMLPTLVIAIVVVLIMLAALAITVFAMQRDTVGI